MNDKIFKLDESLSIEGLYNKKSGPESLYKMGKFEEKEKVDTMFKDIQLKQKHIEDMLVDKEAVEEQLASFGSIHHIYVRIIL